MENKGNVESLDNKVQTVCKDLVEKEENPDHLDLLDPKDPVETLVHRDLLVFLDLLDNAVNLDCVGLLDLLDPQVYYTFDFKLEIKAFFMLLFLS